MLRFLFFLAVVVVVIYFLRKWYRSQGSRPTAAAPPAQPLIACQHCGVLIQEDEAIFKKGRAYCSPAHIE